MFQTTNQYIAACFLGIESSYPNVGWWKNPKGTGRGAKRH